MSKVEYYAGVLEEIRSRPQRITITAPEESQVELQELVCNNGPWEITLVEGLLGDELLPLQCPIDLHFFAKRSTFRFGKITPEEPLHLYVEPFGFPSVAPNVNFTIVGTCTGWEPNKNNTTKRKRVGELAIHDFMQWLSEQGLSKHRAESVLKPVRAFIAGEDLTFGDLEPNAALETYLHVRGISVEKVRAYATKEAEAFRHSQMMTPTIQKKRQRR